MLGPPICGFSLPLTASIESRTSSAVRRRMLERQNKLLLGSTRGPASVALADIWYAFDISTSLCTGLIRQPPRTNSPASQSSSSGWVGNVPNLPKSLDDATSPRPKWCCQRRLTSTRAVAGLSADAIQLARTVRRPLDFDPGGGGGIT